MQEQESAFEVALKVALEVSLKDTLEVALKLGLQLYLLMQSLMHECVQNGSSNQGALIVDLMLHQRVHLVVDLMLDFFFNCYLAAPRLTLGHYRGGNLTHPMLITCALHILPEGHWEPCNEVGSLSPAEGLVGFKLRTFRS